MIRPSTSAAVSKLSVTVILVAPGATIAKYSGHGTTFESDDWKPRNAGR